MRRSVDFWQLQWWRRCAGCCRSFSSRHQSACGEEFVQLPPQVHRPEVAQVVFVLEPQPTTGHEGRTLVGTTAWVGVVVRIAAAEAPPVAKVVKVARILVC